MEYLTENVWLVFFGIAIVLIVLEMFTTDMTAILFGTAFLVGTAGSYFGLSTPVAIGITVVIAAVFYFTIRKPLRDRLHKAIPDEPMGVHRLVGSVGSALTAERIELKANGYEVWSARQEDGSPLTPAESYTVERIDGSSVVVKPTTNN